MFVCVCRNAAVDLVEQELIFTGTEAGKLTSLRDLIRKVITLIAASQAGRREVCGVIGNSGTFITGCPAHAKRLCVCVHVFGSSLTGIILLLSFRVWSRQFWSSFKVRREPRSCMTS